MIHKAQSSGGQRSIPRIRSVAAGLLSCISLACATNSFAQTITNVPDHVIVGKLSAQEMPALEVLRGIEEQTGYKFQIALPFRDYIASQRLSVTFQNAPLPEVMQAISESLSVDFSVSAPQTPSFRDSLRCDQLLGLEIPGQEGLEVFDGGRGR